MTQIAMDGFGNIYGASIHYNTVLLFSPTGTITIYAGSGTAGYSGDGGTAISAELNTPLGVALDVSGDLYITDYGNQRIRKVSGYLAVSAVSASAFRLYPNPVINELNISLPEKIETVTVINVLGQAAFSGVYNENNVTVNLSGIDPGIYFVKVNNEQMQKIVKQ